jgi:hypothetical protein
MRRKRALQSLARFLTADFRARRGERLQRAQSGSVRFVLRAHAALKSLQLRKSHCRGAAGKPVIQASRSGNDTVKDQVADKVSFRRNCTDVCLGLPSSLDKRSSSCLTDRISVSHPNCSIT